MHNSCLLWIFFIIVACNSIPMTDLGSKYHNITDISALQPTPSTKFSSPPERPPPSSMLATPSYSAAESSFTLAALVHSHSLGWACRPDGGHVAVTRITIAFHILHCVDTLKTQCSMKSSPSSDIKLTGVQISQFPNNLQVQCRLPATS